MNAKLAKEERRNLVKAMGETATLAYERCLEQFAEVREGHLRLLHQHAAIAREVEDLKKLTVPRLDSRIDGASAWCEKNEGFAREHLRMTTTFAERMNLIVHGGFFTRLRWLLFGRLPPVPDSAFQRANQAPEVQS